MAVDLIYVAIGWIGGWFAAALWYDGASLPQPLRWLAYKIHPGHRFDRR